ncbi:anti-sigma factor [Bacillus haynesii]|uniref:Anti-sigma factor n=1 Tax=Bacillus haynesii TaxID=1925021 RepID=A0AA90F771_9BACI|nr:anti-sigma factor [Bacillus haynesii]EWH23827.1 anti-sigma-M factor [Bacillus haynesii]MBU8683114.1 anti-sigma factor [Bacillus haynesii]MCI4130100.1 anti-sigma factor [Bacillus haynesii]MCY7753780.1 anti-sigma factor [Bacillus haynesii]MCY7771141.1 anti-sigma factor [Bacillus haynesii]
MNEDFKKRWEKYKNGELSESEMLRVEEELEQLEEYQDMLEQEMKDEDWDLAISPEKQKAILRYGKNKSYMRISTLAVISTLIILPLCTLGSYLYYGLGGHESKGNELVQTASMTVAVTNPNIQVDTEALVNKVKLFGIQTQFPLKKQIGNVTKVVGNENVEMFFDQLKSPQIHQYNQELSNEERHFVYPDGIKEKSVSKAESILKQLPDGTVTEAFLSFERAYPTKELYDQLKGYDIRVLWNAIETEADLKDHPYAEPIGFPGKDSNRIFEIQHPAKNDDEQFKAALSYMIKHNKWAETISGRKNLKLSKRLDYVEKNGVNVYGAVITGPSKEVERLIKKGPVKAAKVGEVELWNW